MDVDRTEVYQEQIDEHIVELGEYGDGFRLSIQELEDDIRLNPKVGRLEGRKGVLSRLVKPSGWRVYFRPSSDRVVMLCADHQRGAGRTVDVLLDNWTDAEAI